jgi:hypothetical protein
VNDKDCTTNQPGLYSRCTCTYNSFGNAYCEYQSGNSDWKDLVELFKDYVSDTVSCHISRGFGHHCFQPESTAKYICKLDRFRNFQKTFKNAGCLQEVSNPYFEPAI